MCVFACVCESACVCLHVCVSLHVCVCTCTCVLSAAPEVEFDADSYSALVFPEETVPVCLVYNYTDSEDRGQFDVVVNLTKDGTHFNISW